MEDKIIENNDFLENLFESIAIVSLSNRINFFNSSALISSVCEII